MPVLFALVSLLVKAEQSRGGEGKQRGSSPPQDAQQSTLSEKLLWDSLAKQGLQQPRAIMKVKSTLIMCLCDACHPCHPGRFLSPGQNGALRPVF